MSYDIKREWPFFILALIPFLLLSYVYGLLPEEVPIHFNAAGDADGFSHKSSLIWNTVLLVVMGYVLMLVVPYIDPKPWLKKMGKKYYLIRLWMMIFMVVLASVIIYSAYEPEVMQTNGPMMLIPLMLFFLGFFLPMIKPNYFVGIRTPWTLEDEENWEATHKMSGKLWMTVCLLLFIAGLFVPVHLYLYLIVFGLIALAVVSAFYSYWFYRKKDAKM